MSIHLPTVLTVTIIQVATKPVVKIATKPAREGPMEPTVAAVTKSTGKPELPKLPNALRKRCLLLEAIPIDIRYMIYDHLLVSVDPIESEEANKLLGENKDILLSCHNPIPNISATLLRTCRTILKEALPRLYGRNVFSFSHPKAIRDFKDDGIRSYFQRRYPLINATPSRCLIYVSYCNFLTVQLRICFVWVL